MAESPISACHHVAICVNDAEAAKRFYGESIGLEEIQRPSEITIAGAWYRLGSSELHVFESEGFQPPASASFPPHLALRSEDFQASVERLRSADVKIDFGPAQDDLGIWRVVVRDPTGNVVEVTDAPLTSG